MGMSTQFTGRFFKWHVIHLKRSFVSFIITEMPGKKKKNQNGKDQHTFTGCVLARMWGSKYFYTLGQQRGSMSVALKSLNCIYF